MSDTPSQQIVAAAKPKTAILTDARGRRLEVRELTGLDQLRLLRAIGPAQSGNREYGWMVECLTMVSAIDGVPLVMPRNEQGIDAAMMKVGDDGVQTVMLWRTQRIMEAQKAAEEAMADAPEDAPAPSPLAASES